WLVGARPALVARRIRREIELLAGLAAHLRRVHEPIAAHPDLVVRIRQVRDDVAAAIVGDDDLGILGRQLGRFRDHPDAGLRPIRAGHYAADVIVVDLYCRLLCAGGWDLRYSCSSLVAVRWRYEFYLLEIEKQVISTSLLYTGA